MATAAKHPSHAPSAESPLPGDSVLLLLQQDRLAEARAELESSLIEGIDSGDPLPLTADLFEDIGERALEKATRKP